MTLSVSKIRWDLLTDHIKSKGPNKPMEDHQELQVDGREVTLREGICVDPTIKPYPMFLSHLLISGGESSIEASVLLLDPVEKKGMIMLGASVVGIEEDGSITEIYEIDPEKAKNVGLDDQSVKILAVSHKDIYLKILRQMNIV